MNQQGKLAHLKHLPKQVVVVIGIPPSDGFDEQWEGMKSWSEQSYPLYRQGNNHGLAFHCNAACSKCQNSLNWFVENFPSAELILDRIVICYTPPPPRGPLTTAYQRKCSWSSPHQFSPCLERFYSLNFCCLKVKKHSPPPQSWQPQQQTVWLMTWLIVGFPSALNDDYIHYWSSVEFVEKEPLKHLELNQVECNLNRHLFKSFFSPFLLFKKSISWQMKGNKSPIFGSVPQSLTTVLLDAWHIPLDLSYVNLFL